MADELARRLQAVLRTVGALGNEVHECGPFTVLVDRDDPLVHFNYALPREPVGGDLTAELAALRDVFARVARVPRLEFLEEFAPALAGELERAGFALELRQPLMTCTNERLVRPPRPGGYRGRAGRRGGAAHDAPRPARADGRGIRGRDAARRHP